MQNKTSQSYAPFGSATTKNPSKKKNPQLMPGPGTYNVSLPMVAPMVQTIKKPNNNVIVKLGHFGTAPFLAGGSRFNQNRNSMDPIGPGTYQKEEQKIKESSPRRERIYASQKIHEIIKVRAESNPTITNIKVVTFDDNDVEMPMWSEKSKKAVKKDKIKGINWSRMSNSRLLQVKQELALLGPGSYELPKLSVRGTIENQPSSSFNSKIVRSFFDQIRYETNQDSKARQREQRKYKSDIVGPGSYQIEDVRKNKKFRFQFFGSTEERK